MQEGDIIDGRYKVQNKLGQGGMGQVFRGHDFELDKTVAIKVLFPNTPDQVIKRFHTEARALAKFNHPNIMRVEHFGQASNGQLYLVNEFVKGESLSTLIEQRGPQTFFDVLPIFEKICRGLRYAHMEKVQHRDIKPSNVMLTADRSREDSVKLVDFGLAKPNEDYELTKTGTAMGSPPYMSPEAVHGKETDFRSDIYSLGCTLFEMMAAVPPFVGETPFHTMMAHINRLPPTLQEACDKQFDEEVENFVQKFIKKNPADRFQNMDEVITELDRVKNVLIEKRNAADASMASGLYTSSAKLLKETQKLNAALKVVSIVVGVIVVIAVPIVWMKSAYENAPKTAVAGDSSEAARPKAVRTEENEDKFDDSTTGLTAHKAGAQLLVKSENRHDDICLISGNLSEKEVQDIMIQFKDVKTFQFEDATIEPSSVRQILKLPIEKLNFVNMKVTEVMLEAVGQMSQLQLLRINRCADLPDGSLDLLKPLKNNKAFMSLELSCGLGYRKPVVPFAHMPMLIQVKYELATITREDMKAFGSMKNLQELEFKYCSFAPDAIPELKKAKKCAKLGITQCELTQQQFQQIGELSSVQLLQMNNTNLDNAGLSKLKNLKKLMYIDVQRTQVDENGMRELMKAIPALTPTSAKFGQKIRDEL